MDLLSVRLFTELYNQAFCFHHLGWASRYAVAARICHQSTAVARILPSYTSYSALHHNALPNKQVHAEVNVDPLDPPANMTDGHEGV